MLDLNQRPIAYRATALPTELIDHCLVYAVGLEPTVACDDGFTIRSLTNSGHAYIFGSEVRESNSSTQAYETCCETNITTRYNLVGPSGIEPLTSCSSDRRSTN